LPIGIHIQLKIYVMRAFSTFFFIAVLGHIALAQTPTFHAKASATQVAVSQAFEVTFTLENGKIEGRFLPPDWSRAGFTLLGNSQASSISINGGVTTSTATYTYTLMPRDTGIFEIPSAIVHIGGKEWRTEPLSIRVRAGAAGEIPTDTQAKPTPKPAAEPKKKVKTIKI
jgi:hypothetical protein